MLTLAVAAAGCRSLPEPDKAMALQPETAARYFKALVANGEYGKAHLLLSSDTRSRIKQEVFAMALQSYPTLRKLLLESEIAYMEQGGRPTLLVGTPAADAAFPLVKEFDKIWTIEIGANEWERLQKRGEEWLFHQFEKAGGYHVFPPDYQFRPLSRR